MNWTSEPLFLDRSKLWNPRVQPYSSGNSRIKRLGVVASSRSTTKVATWKFCLMKKRGLGQITRLSRLKTLAAQVLHRGLDFILMKINTNFKLRTPQLRSSEKAQRSLDIERWHFGSVSIFVCWEELSFMVLQNYKSFETNLWSCNKPFDQDSS